MLFNVVARVVCIIHFVFFCSIIHDFGAKTTFDSLPTYKRTID